MNTFTYKSNFKKRIIATILDYSIILLVSWIFIFLVGEEQEDGTRVITGLLALVPIAAWFAYFIVVEACYGATLAHQALDLKVITDKRKEIGIEHAFRRHLVDPIDILMWGIPAFVAIKNSEKKQRIG